MGHYKWSVIHDAMLIVVGVMGFGPGPLANKPIRQKAIVELAQSE